MTQTQPQKNFTVNEGGNDLGRKKTHKRQKHNYHHENSHFTHTQHKSSHIPIMEPKSIHVNLETYETVLAKKNKYKNIIKKRDAVIDQLRNENEKLRQMLLAQDGQIAEQQEEIMTSQKDNEQLRNEKANNIKNEDQGETDNSLVNENKIIQNRNELLKNNMMKLEKRYNFLKLQNFELKQDFLRSKEELKRMNSLDSIKSLQVLTNYIQTMESKRQDLTSQLASLEKDNQNLRLSTDRICKVFVVLAKHVELLNSQISGSSQYSPLEQSIKDLTQNDTQLIRSQTRITELISKLELQSQELILVKTESIQAKQRQCQIWKLYNDLKNQRNRAMDMMVGSQDKVDKLKLKVKRSKSKSLYEKVELQRQSMRC